MKNPVLELGNGNWGIKDGSMLGYAQGDDVTKFIPRFMDFARGSDLTATRTNKEGLIEKGRQNLIHYSNNISDSPSAGTFWTGTSSYEVSPNQLGYDGTNDAFLVRKVTDLNSYMYSSNSMSLTSGIWNYSIYAKAGESNAIWMYTGSGSGSGTGGCAFILEGNGSVYYATNEAVATSIEKLDNGWYRCSITSKTSNTYRVRFQPINARGTGTSVNDTFSKGSIYVQHPQVEVGPVPTAPIVTGALNNILRNSVDITRSPWSKTAGLTIRKNARGYDGSQNAFRLNKTANWDRIIQDIPRHPALGTEYTVTAYAKAGSLEAVIFRIDADDDGDNDSRSMEAKFELKDGGRRLAQETGTVAKIEKVGNEGWFKCTVKYTTSTSYTQTLFVYPAGWAGADSGPGHIFVQDIQVEIGHNPKPYEPTSDLAGLLSDQPRLDYSDTDPHLLLECTRENLITYSEWINDWGNSGDGTSTITPNHAISPDGYKSATKYTANNGYRHLRKSVTLLADTNYVFSFYAKNIDATVLKASVYDTTNATWVVQSQSYVNDVNTDTWSRIEIPFTTNSDSTTYAVYISHGRQTLTEGDPGGSVLFWGGQVEKGNFATSYIPTQGSTATRTEEGSPTGDAVGIASVYDMSEFFDGDDWTMYFELEENPILTRDNSSGGIRLSDGNAQAGSIRIYRNSSNGVRFRALMSPTTGDDTAVNLGNVTKVAIKRVRSTGVFTFYGDGAAIDSSVTDANGRMTAANFDVTMDDLHIRGFGSLMKLKGFKLFNEALADTDLATLTS